MKRETFKISETTIVNYCRGVYKGADAARIEEAIAASSDLQELVLQIRKVLVLEQDIDEVRNINIQTAYKKVSKRIFQKHSGVRTILGFVNRYAAVLLLPLLVSSIVFAGLYFSQNSHAITYCEVSTPLGSTMRYELSDGSVVWLNAGSKLRFPNRFAQDIREVELWGEGYFEVKADIKHPFYVKMENGSKVFAYGTRFNVNSYSDEEFVETVLEKGKVNIISHDGKSSVVLQPGERGVISKGDHSMLVEKTGLYEKTAWREGKLIFRNDPLADVFKRLSRQFNVDIKYENPEDREYSYRATFKNENLYQILDYLKLIAPIEYRVLDTVQNHDSTFPKRIIEITLRR